MADEGEEGAGGEQEGDYLCMALTDYYAAAGDELDLRTGAVYTVIQTSESGWWYAEDEDGQDGWCPSNYLVRLDEEEEDDDWEDSDEEATGAAATGGKDTTLLVPGSGSVPSAGSSKVHRASAQVISITADDSDSEDEDKDDEDEDDFKKSDAASKKAVADVTAASLAKMRKWEEVKKKQEEKRKKKEEEEVRKRELEEEEKRKEAEEIRRREEEEVLKQQELEAMERANAAERSRLEEEKLRREEEREAERRRLEEERRREEEAAARIERERVAAEELAAQRVAEAKEKKRLKKEARAAKKKARQKRKAEKALKKYEAERKQLEAAKAATGASALGGAVGGGGMYGARMNPAQVSRLRVDEIIAYLSTHFPLKAKRIDRGKIDMFEVKSVLTRVAQVAANYDSQREELAKQRVLDLLLNVLRFLSKDLAISMASCSAISQMCRKGTAARHPAKGSRVRHLATAIQGSYKNAIFCFEAFKCICNFTHRNDAHKRAILEDKDNRHIVRCVIEGMERFRYVEEVSKREHCRKVTMAGCLALQNLAANTLGRQIIGKEGVECLLGAFVAHIEDMEVVEKCLQTLKNLVVLQANSEAFLAEDGMEYLRTLCADVDTSAEVRRMCADVLANVMQTPSLCVKLAKSQDAIDTMQVLLATTKVDTNSYPAVLRLINPFLIRQSHQRLSLSQKLAAVGLLSFLNQGLAQDWSQPLPTEAPDAADVAAVIKEITVTMKLILSTKNQRLMQDLIANELPDLLINCCIDYGELNTAILENAFAIYFYILDITDMHLTLVSNGLAFLLFESQWHKLALSTNPCKLALGSMVKLIKNYANTKSEWDLDDAAEGSAELLEWAKGVAELKVVATTLQTRITKLRVARA